VKTGPPGIRAQIERPPRHRPRASRASPTEIQFRHLGVLQQSVGVAAVHIEDQTTPKRCGHIAGKQIVSREDAVRYAETLHETHPEVDLAFNYSSSFAWSEEDDPLTFVELGDLGYKYVFITLYALHSGAHGVYEDGESVVTSESDD